MSDAPERIWAEPYEGNKGAGRWTSNPRYPELPTQYIRVDLYEEARRICLDQAKRIAKLRAQDD